MNLPINQFFRLLSDDTRLRSLLLMKQQGELCVCELVHALDIIQPKVSRHLAMLRDAGLVSDRRQGQWVYYQLHPDLPTWARSIIDAAAAEAANLKAYNHDLTMLTEMPNRPGSACCA